MRLSLLTLSLTLGLTLAACTPAPSRPRRSRDLPSKSIHVVPDDVEETPSEPPSKIPAAITQARARLSIARATSAPEIWHCRAYPKRPKAPKRLRAWSDTFAAQSFQGLQRDQLIPPQELADWKNLRWLYVRKGFCQPELFLRHGVVTLDFLGHPVRVHPQLARRLQRVAQTMQARNELPPFAWAGALSPRTVRGPFKRPPKRLSNHALGLAIDLEPVRNPYLSRRELALIKEITGHSLPRAATLTAAARWDSFHKAHTDWIAMAPGWLASQTQKVDTLRQRKRHRQARRLAQKIQEVKNSANLTRANEHGFLKLTRAFVVEMEAAGLTWATDFKAGADLMHFELRR